MFLSTAPAAAPSSSMRRALLLSRRMTPASSSSCSTSNLHPRAICGVALNDDNSHHGATRNHYLRRMAMATCASFTTTAVAGAGKNSATGNTGRNATAASSQHVGINGLAAPTSTYPSSSSSSSSQKKLSSSATGKTVKGTMLDLARDLRTARPGDVITPPYELTVSEAMQDFWQSAFHNQDRISTSTPFARKIGLQDRVLPFSLVLFLTSGMTHADAAKVQVGFDNATYHFPAFQGDTFTKRFTVKSVRNTSDGHHTVIHFACELINQRGRVCMSADKRMMFEFSVPECLVMPPTDPSANDSHLFRDHLLSKAKVLKELGSHSLKRLHPGQLILHRMARSVTQSQAQQLASLVRLTHERHFDTRKFDSGSEIMVPGGLVLGLAMSASSRDLHEVLHEEIVNATFVNMVHPGNVVGGITYVQSVDDNAPGDLELLRVKTLGMKNLDVSKDLDGVELPLELFATGESSPLPKDIERICKEKCPMLSKKIVVQMERRIIRQASHKEVFLL